MKKSLLRGLFLLSCLFFFSNVDVSAQTFRADADIKNDIPSEITTLETEYNALDKNDANWEEKAILVKKRIHSLNMFERELDNFPTEELLAIVLSKQTNGSFAKQDYYEGDYAEQWVLDLKNYLFDFITE